MNVDNDKAVFVYQVTLQSLLDHINYMEEDNLVEDLSQEDIGRFTEIITDAISDAVTEFSQEIREGRESA